MYSISVLRYEHEKWQCSYTNTHIYRAERGNLRPNYSLLCSENEHNENNNFVLCVQDFITIRMFVADTILFMAIVVIVGFHYLVISACTKWLFSRCWSVPQSQFNRLDTEQPTRKIWDKKDRISNGENYAPAIRLLLVVVRLVFVLFLRSTEQTFKLKYINMLEIRN